MKASIESNLYYIILNWKSYVALVVKDASTR